MVVESSTSRLVSRGCEAFKYPDLYLPMPDKRKARGGLLCASGEVVYFGLCGVYRTWKSQMFLSNSLPRIVR